LTAQLAVA
jgi:hypothetical protein